MSESGKGWKDSNWYASASGFWREYRKHRIGIVGIIIMSFFVGMAIMAPYLGTSDPNPLTTVAPTYLAPSWMSVFDSEAVVTGNLLTTEDMDQEPLIHVNGTSSEFSATYFQAVDPGDPSYTNLTWEHTAGTQLDYYGVDPDNTMPSYGDFVYLEQEFDWDFNALPNGINMTISFGTSLTGDFAPGAKTGNNLMFRLYVWMVDTSGEWVRVYETLDATYSETIHERRFPITYTALRDVFSGMIEVNGTQEDPGNSVRVRVGLAPHNLFEVNSSSWGFVYPWQNWTGGVTFTVHGVNMIGYGGYYGGLGTTFWGADAYSQLIYGSRVSLIIGVLATGLSTIVGVLVGLAAGYFGGGVDEVLMRVVDFLLVIPGLPLMMVLAIFLGESTTNIIIVISILGWTGTARLIRSQVLAEKNKAYVESARAIGANDTYIMFRHILPNVTPILFANITLGVVGSILAEAGLSFLGLTNIEEPSWGRMLADAQNGAAFIRGAWWVVLFPGLMITLLSLSFTFVGHTLDQVLNPRLRER
ncbi:MAG: ABC transporter permease [Candidatus Thorarchaeota archaeon]